jgi:hypothetical protein
VEICLAKAAFADKPVLHNILRLCMYESSVTDGYALTEYGQCSAHLTKNAGGLLFKCVI